MPSISFVNDGVPLRLKNKTILKNLFSEIFRNENAIFEKVTFIFSNDSTLSKLNLKFLNHNTLTDVLTFILSEDYSPLLSEIYISIDRVRENAKIFNVSFTNELHRVMIHGILHLCGFSDHTPHLKTKMHKREDFYLSQFSFT